MYSRLKNIIELAYIRPTKINRNYKRNTETGTAVNHNHYKTTAKILIKINAQ